MNRLALLEEAQKLVRMGSFLWLLDSDELACSRSLCDILGIDASERLTRQALIERFRTEDRPRLMAVLRDEDGTGGKGTVFAIERDGSPGLFLQVRTKSVGGGFSGSAVLGTVLEVDGPANREHEVNNLLMVVQGNLDLIRMNVSKPDRIPIHLDLATHAVERLAALSETTRSR